MPKMNTKRSAGTTASRPPGLPAGPAAALPLVANADLTPTPRVPLFSKRQSVAASVATAVALSVSGCDEEPATYDAGVYDAGISGDIGVFDGGISVFDAGVDLGGNDAGVAFDAGVSPSDADVP